MIQIRIFYPMEIDDLNHFLSQEKIDRVEFQRALSPADEPYYVVFYYKRNGHLRPVAYTPSNAPGRDPWPAPKEEDINFRSDSEEVPDDQTPGPIPAVGEFDKKAYMRSYRARKKRGEVNNRPSDKTTKCPYCNKIVNNRGFYIHRQACEKKAELKGKATGQAGTPAAEKEKFKFNENWMFEKLAEANAPISATKKPGYP